MSPWTALFLGMFGFGSVVLVAGTTVVLYGMRIAEKNITDVFGLTEQTIANLPEIIESLPPSVQDLLNDRRAPEYRDKIDVQVRLVTGSGGQRLFPALTITNNGDEVVSLLTVRVAALDAVGTAVQEWTELVATPIGIEDELRGPLMPHATRHVRLGRCRPPTNLSIEKLTGVGEISDVRIWLGAEATATQVRSPQT
ncbi:MAG: hypothetical protein ACE5E5_08465 [Phycisphaerae bacterium]